MGANTFSTQKKNEQQSKSNSDDTMNSKGNGSFTSPRGDMAGPQIRNMNKQQKILAQDEQNYQNIANKNQQNLQQKKHQMVESPNTFQQSLQNQISAASNGKIVTQNQYSDDFNSEDEEEEDYGCEDSDDNPDDFDDSFEDDDQDDDDDDDDDEDDDEDEEDLEGTLFDGVNIDQQNDQSQQFSNNFFIAQQIHLNRKTKNKLNKSTDAAANILMQGFLKDASPAQRAELQQALEQQQLKQIQIPMKMKQLTKQELNQWRNEAQEMAIRGAIPNSSDDDNDDDMCHVDLLNLDENFDQNANIYSKIQQKEQPRRQKHSSTAQSQRIREKLQKPMKKQQENTQKENSQNQAHSQKLQRIKNQQNQQLKKGVSNSQKQFREDKKQSSNNSTKGSQTPSKSGGAGNSNNVQYELQCQEKYQQDQGISNQSRKQQKRQAKYQQMNNEMTMQNEIYEQQQMEGQQEIVDDKYSDNSSQYEDIQNEMIEEDEDDICGEDDDQHPDMFDPNDQDIENLLTENLEIPVDMSPQFHRFYENFTKYIEFIIKYEYNILPQQKCYQNINEGAIGSSQQIDSYLIDQRQRDAAQLILKRKYDNYKKLCDKYCKCFTGPYSVLQIFIEKIVDAIQSFAQKLRVLAHDDLHLWEEGKNNTNQFAPLIGNHVNYTHFLQNVTCHYNLIIKSYAQAISTHFTRMTKVINGNSYEFPSVDMHRTIINKLIINDIELFKDFFDHIKNEFQSNEKSIQNKILKETQGGNQKSRLSRDYQKFLEVYNFFVVEVQQDISKGVQLLNIDIQMQDLRRHALKEYDEIHINEIEILNKDPSVKNYLASQEAATSQEKLNADINNASSQHSAFIRMVAQYSELLNQRYGIIISQQQQNDSPTEYCDENGNLESDFLDLNMLDPKEKKKLKKKQRKREKKIKQQMAMFGHFADTNTQISQGGGFNVGDTHVQSTQIQSNFEGQQNKLQGTSSFTGQSNIGSIEANTNWANTIGNQEDYQVDEMNQHSKKTTKKKGKNGKLSQEEIKHLSTDELLSYIQNEGMKYKNSPHKNQKGGGPTIEGDHGQFESKSVQNFRAKLKAKAAVQSPTLTPAQQKAGDKSATQQGRLSESLSKEQKRLDSNNFTCKYCAGALDQTLKKFVHDKNCQLSSTPAPNLPQKAGNYSSVGSNNQSSSERNQKKAGSKTSVNQRNQSELSTQGSNSIATNSNDADFIQDEEKHVQEFAKKLEIIQKQPPLRYSGTHGGRRRRKLKPNVSVDWLNQLRKELKSQSRTSQKS